MNFRKTLRSTLAHIWPFSRFIIRLDHLYSEVAQLRKQLDFMSIELNDRISQLQESDAKNRFLTTYNDQMHQELTQSNANNTTLTEENLSLKGGIHVLGLEKQELQRVNEILKKQLDVHNSMHKINSSSAFWEGIYVNGGNSGTGSYNRLAEFKAEVVNSFLNEQEIFSAIELGCGDGNQLSLIDYKQYTGIDVSQTIVDKNRQKFREDDTKRFFCSPTEREMYIHDHYDLAISMDVVFHLLEESVFVNYMEDLFGFSSKYVIIYSSNHEEYTIWPEYRHRKFMKYFQEHIKGWRLHSFIPNKYPYVIGEEEDTSAADFYIFEKTL